VSDPTGRTDGGDGLAGRVQQILAYHEVTKHHLHRYARGPGGLDWANQPDPFRTYAGAPAIDLPLLADALDTPYVDLFAPGAVAPRPLGLESVAALFELSLGLSAWKEYGHSRWALRCNPSSGNLHPTEGYAVVPPLPGLPAGVYHYVSRDHRLERRCTLTGGAAGAPSARLPTGSFLVGLSSVHWREAWKYGERAYRYCQHDAGHALAAVRFAAAALGWSAHLLDAPADADVAAVLGLDRDADLAAVTPADREHPDALIVVGPPPLAVPAVDAGLVAVGTWAGTANALSREHVSWVLIDRAAAAARKPATAPEPVWQPPPLPPAAQVPSPVPAAALMRQRRSALAFDGRTPIGADDLYHMLDRLLPRPDVPPWDALPWRARVHLAIFVHRVSGLAPGLYLFARDPAAVAGLRSALRPQFRWERPPRCPDHLPLWLLAEADLRAAAQMASCHQEIAAGGAFSLGMVAEFGDTLWAGGPWWYRRLFWETGLVGQVLYLEAEAAGVRGTGIGCYFDDAVHELLGLAGDRYQSLYHFTVGAPVDDPRLRTLAPYAHLGTGRALGSIQAAREFPGPR
jgi:SagB-type dehydrogenase family enzyme